MTYIWHLFCTINILPFTIITIVFVANTMVVAYIGSFICPSVVGHLITCIAMIEIIQLPYEEEIVYLVEFVADTMVVAYIGSFIGPSVIGYHVTWFWNNWNFEIIWLLQNALISFCYVIANTMVVAYVGSFVGPSVIFHLITYVW